mgnify:CR=1 FL=1
MIVDKSLSKGLADRVLADFEDVAVQHVKACARIACEIPGKRCDVRRIATSLSILGERASLSQVLGSHPKWRWAVVASFLPLPGFVDGGTINNRTTRYYLFPVHLHVNKRGVLPREPVPILEVREHALERLFQRLNSTDPETVKDEIHDALCLSPHLLVACRALSLRQVVLPTQSGAFLCTLDSPLHVIQANTWIPYGACGTRREKAAAAIAECHKQLGGPRVIAEAIAALPYGENLKAVESLVELETVLRRFHWLREEYEPGVDSEGEVWRQARAQADNVHEHTYRAAA